MSVKNLMREKERERGGGGEREKGRLWLNRDKQSERESMRNKKSQSKYK